MTKNTETMGKYISILYRSGSVFFNHKFEKFSIGSGQYPFLLFLYHNGGVTQEEMSCKLFIDKGTTAKAVKKLEDEGYIKRMIDEKDKRAYKVYLTEEGRQTANEVFKVLYEWNNTLTSDFTEEEKELALSFLQRMVKNKSRIIRKENVDD